MTVGNRPWNDHRLKSKSFNEGLKLSLNVDFQNRLQIGILKVSGLRFQGQFWGKPSLKVHI